MTVNSGVELESDTLTGQLLCVLRVLTGSDDLEYARPPEPLTGGFWAELIAFSLADPPPGWSGELAARLMPDPDVAGRKPSFRLRSPPAFRLPPSELPAALPTGSDELS